MEELVKQILTEHGLLVVALLAANIAQWRQNVALATKLLSVVEKNTEVMTKLVQRVNEHAGEKENDN